MTRTVFTIAGALLVPACAAATTDVAGASAPGLSFPISSPARASTSVSEERSEPEPASAPEESPRAAPAGELPDPTALALTRQWEYELLYEQGEVSVVDVRALLFEKPVATARRVGRFAVELWIGRELIDRVRFDFPGLAVEPPPSGPRHPLDEPPTFAAGAVVSRKILVPASPRATRAELVDRATGARIPLPWPPDAPLDPAPSAPQDPAEPSPDREPNSGTEARPSYPPK